LQAGLTRNGAHAPGRGVAALPPGNAPASRVRGPRPARVTELSFSRARQRSTKIYRTGDTACLQQI